MIEKNLRLIQRVYGCWALSLKLGISERTWRRKMRCPKSFTLAELEIIAKYCDISLEALLFKELII